ncbi:MAG: hypothetical protein K9J13_02190 [Saprospiraceae bacterium]|nr:hypothetical protein [Saprospiraceae bacterium]
MRIFLLVVISLIGIDSISQNTSLFLNPSLGNLYYGIPNEIYVKSNLKDCSGYQLITDDTILISDSCSFIYIPRKLGSNRFILKNIKLNKSDTFKVYIQPFDDIKVDFHRSKFDPTIILDSLIIKSEILDKLSIQHNIKSYNVMICSKDTIEIFNNGCRFQNETISKINKVRRGDTIIINGITIIINNKECPFFDVLQYRFNPY